MDKKEFKQCPDCGDKINRKNFKAVITKCLMCGKYICPTCKINETCQCCYIGENVKTELFHYNSDKYAHGVTS